MDEPTWIRERRADGWPYCPRCEEDELWSALQRGGRDERPPMRDYIAAGMACYRCGWTTNTLFQCETEEGAMNSNEHGLYAKYFVRRNNDPTGKHADCPFFVLDIRHDAFARVALKAYIDACRGQEPTPKGCGLAE